MGSKITPLTEKWDETLAGEKQRGERDVSIPEVPG